MALLTGIAQPRFRSMQHQLFSSWARGSEGASEAPAASGTARVTRESVPAPASTSRPADPVPPHALGY